MTVWVLVVGLLMNLIALPIAGKRIGFLYRLITSGQPAPDRVENVRERVGETVKDQVVKVLGQKKLLKWSVPGAAHFFVFWAFLILASVYLEAYGSLFHDRLRHPAHRPLGPARLRAGLHRRDGCLVGLAVFAAIRLRERPGEAGPQVPLRGLAPRRRLARAADDLLRRAVDVPVPRGAASSPATSRTATARSCRTSCGSWLEPLGEGTNETLEHVGLLLHIGVMLVFLIIVLQLQAPAHLRRAAERHVRPSSRSRSARSSR